MTDDEFTTYLRDATASYAESHIRAHRWPAEEARQRAEDEFARLLPNGTDTEGHHLFTASDNDERVGMTWFAEQDDGRTAYVYDIRIDPTRQGHGYGEAVMRLLEQKALTMGMHTLRLHVFADNSVARSLYRKLGFAETNVIMTKPLDR
jgi:ribosomal protein S18 acetylase RimI-like enzyme